MTHSNRIINPKHREEWLESAIDPELIAANLISFANNPEDFQAAVHLICPNSTQEASAKAWAERKLKFLKDGAWGFYNTDLDGNDTGWGIVKADNPRLSKDEKIIKYETQWGTETEIFLPRVPVKIWKEVCDRYDITYPDFSAISFWRWVSEVNVPIFITEGLKKGLALLTQGYVCLSISGIHGGYRAIKEKKDNKEITVDHELRKDLLPFVEVKREWFICFDRDKKHRTIRDVNNAGAQLASVIAKHNKDNPAEVRIVRLPGNAQKGVDDFLVENSPEDFQKLVEEASAPIKMLSLSERDIPFDTHIIDNNERYLGNLEDIKQGMAPAEAQAFDRAKIVGIRAAKGTGKTTAIADLVQEHLKVPGNKVLLLTHRIQLGRELSRRMGVPYVDDQVGNGLHAIGFGLCVDSLHKNSKANFRVEDYTGHDVLVVIDEAEQVVDHLLTASTEVAKHRTEVLRNLREIFAGVFEPSDAGRIVLSDADLSYLSLEFVKGLAEAKDKDVFVIDKHYQPVAGRKAFFYESAPELLAKLVSDIGTMPKGQKIWVALQGQQDSASYSTKNVERRIKEEYGDRFRILRIDAESVSDPTHPAFGCIDKLNEIVKEYDIILASPSVSTGVSVDRLQDGSTQFLAVFSFMTGVCSVGGSCQAIERVREDCDRHIFADERGFTWIGHSAVTNKTAAYKYLDYNAKAVLQFSQYQHDIRYTYQQAEDSWVDLAVRHNQQLWNYRNSITTQLVFEGYEIQKSNFACDKRQESLKQSVIKDVAYADKRKEILKAEDLTKDQYEQSKAEKQKTEAARHAEAKYLLKRKYNIPVTDNLIQWDDAGWYSMLRKEYFISRFEQLMRHETVKLENLTGANHDVPVFRPDIVKAAMLPEIAALYKIGLTMFLDDYYTPNLEALRNGEPIDKENCFNPKDCDLLDRFMRLVKQPHVSGNLKASFGIKVSDKISPTQFLGNLLAKFGFKLEAASKSGDKRLYYITRGIKKCTDADTLELINAAEQIFARWDEKYTEFKERDAVRKAEQAAANELVRLEQELYGAEYVDPHVARVDEEDLMDTKDYHRKQLELFWRLKSGVCCRLADKPKKARASAEANPEKDTIISI